MSLTIGTRLGPYEISSPLGEGGMGDVYRARDTRLDRTVAIKVSKENFSERFEREARAIAALNHPHICQLYDVGPNFLVMEYVDGAPLAGPLPADQALRYATQICDALDAAHRKGIVHRDLKPANILVTKSGVKLLDFGIARVTTGSDDPTLTGAGVAMGTPAYMAPEQWDGKPADARSDIYAFGCVLHEMLTGKRMSQERLSVKPATINAVLNTCLEQDPENRWQSVRDMRRALELPTPEAVPARSSWRARAGWITASVLALLFGALLFVAFTKEPATAPVRKVELSVNPPEHATFSGGGLTVTIPVPAFALSPDGVALVFSAATAGSRPSLWLRALERGTPILLPGTESAVMPFWSPNGEWIAFFADGKLKKIPASGGPAQVVLDGVPDPRGGSWGPDDTILVGNGTGSILRVASRGGSGTAVTTLDASRRDRSHRWPVWLPDGHQFLFTIRNNSTENSGVYVAAPNATPKKLAIRGDNSVADASGFVLYPDGDTLFGQAWDADRLELSGQPIAIAERVGISTNGLGAFSISNNGALAYSRTVSSTGRLIWFDRGGSQVGTIDSESDYVDFRLSPDDKRLATSIVDPRSGNPDIWLTDFARGNRSRFTFGPRLNASPVWSPDGARIVFRTTRNGGSIDLYQKSSASGGDEVPVLPQAVLLAVHPESTNINVSDWSADNRHLLYSMATTSRTDLWLLPLMDGQKPFKFIATQSENMHGNFSPDGRLVAYTSNDSGRFEIYVQTFPLSDRKWTVSTTGGYEPRWRADGREIYFLSEDRRLMAASVGPGPSFGVPQPLFQTRVPPGVTAFRTHYTPTRDGTRFLVNTESSDAPPVSITVVLNWLAGIAR